jgi:hypothetical protein
MGTSYSAEKTTVFINSNNASEFLPFETDLLNHANDIMTRVSLEE